MLNLPWTNTDAIGHVFIVVNGPISNKLSSQLVTLVVREVSLSLVGLHLMPIAHTVSVRVK